MQRSIPIWRDAMALLVDIEQVVRHFPRYYKYTLGTELRQQAMFICRQIHRAWNYKRQASAYLSKLVLAIDDLKLQLQLAKELQVFRNFAEFERLSSQVINIGRQSGGWLKKVIQ